MPQKTPEELEAERREAQEQINQILDMTRPKNLRQGVGSGLSNIVAGAVGAVGVAILMPTLGMAVGAKSGGLLGLVVGLTGGAVVGGIGAAALAVGGTLTGVTQMVRGVVAVPQQLLAPKEGKWWNENEGKWVLTKMDEEAKNLEGVPEDNSDILGDLQKKLDEQAEEGPKGEVVDMYYYEQLDVPADADAATIKRRYYLLARKYHPDKCPGDQEAAEKFKAVAEAYQVLSDPVLRAKYDKDGREGLSADKTSVTDGAPQIDPTILFAFLFGSDKFGDYTGPLATATSASIGDSPEISKKDARILQKRRVARLALKMITKITPWTDQKKEGADASTIESEWKSEAEELTKASFGYQLVSTIGKIYNLMGIQYEGSMESGQGLPGVSKWAAAQRAHMDKRSDLNRNKMETLKAGIDMMKLESKMKQKLAEAKTDEEKEAIEKEMRETAVGIMLRVLWTVTVVDITSTLYEMCQMVFFDQCVDAQTRKLRAAAVKQLGAIWMEIPEPEKDENEEEKDAMRMYEEAAFAAMLETVKRKDEAAHPASQTS